MVHCVYVITANNSMRLLSVTSGPIMQENSIFFYSVVIFVLHRDIL